MTAGDRITELNNIHLDTEFHFLIANNDQLISWNEGMVRIGNQIVDTKGIGKIVNVIPNTYHQGHLAAFFTEDLKLNDHYSIYLLQKNGEIDFLKIIIKSIDIGLPELLFSPTGLVLLQPEGQKVQIISFRNGTGIEYSLFNKSSWSHEKKLLYSENYSGNIYLLGMKSADLNAQENVSIFKLNNEPNLIRDLPLTIPYFFSISNENISAIVGTQSQLFPNQQKPFLIFYDINHQTINQTIALKKLPQKTGWFRDQFFLIYRDKILIYNDKTTEPLRRRDFQSKIYPIDSWIIDQSVYIIAGGNIEADNHGNIYQSIILKEYNMSDQSASTILLQDGLVRNVDVFPLEMVNSFYLRLDNLLIQYRIIE